MSAPRLDTAHRKRINDAAMVLSLALYGPQLNENQWQSVGDLVRRMLDELLTDDDASR